MPEPLSDAALAALSAVADSPTSPKIEVLHRMTQGYHLNPLSTLLTVVRLERRGLVKSKEGTDGKVRYEITDAGREALGD